MAELAIIVALLVACGIVSWALYSIARQESDFDTSFNGAVGAAIFLTGLAIAGWVIWSRWVPIAFIVLSALFGVTAFMNNRNPKVVAAKAARVAIERQDAAVHDVDTLLETAFNRHTRGEMSLTEYRRLVEDERDAANARYADLRRDRRSMDPDIVEFEEDEIEASLEAVEWRLQWIEDQEFKGQFKRAGFAEAGKSARFDYADREGNLTKRSIANWKQQGTYIVGWDRSRKEERTFRQDRISHWIAE